MWEEIIVTTVSPLPRKNSAILKTESHLIIFGGMGQKLYSDLWELEISQKTWRVLSPNIDLPIGIKKAYLFVRNKHNYCLTGGTNAFSDNNNRIFCFSRTKLAWFEIKTAPDQNFTGGAYGYFAEKDHLYSFGGLNTSNLATAKLRKVDLSLETQTGLMWEDLSEKMKGDIPSSRAFFEAVAYNSIFQVSWDKILHTGNGIYNLDVESLTWAFVTNETMQSQKTFRIEYVLAKVGHNGSFYFSPTGDLYNLKYKTHENKEIKLDMYKKAVSSPERRGFQCFMSNNKHIIIFGGQSTDGRLLSDMWLFDLKLKEWVEIQPKSRLCPGKRYLHSCTSAGLRFILYGGMDEFGALLADFWSADIDLSTATVTWSLLNKTSPPGPRAGHRIGPFSTHELIIQGNIYPRPSFKLHLFTLEWTEVGESGNNTANSFYSGTAALYVTSSGVPKHINLGSSSDTSGLEIFSDLKRMSFAPNVTRPGSRTFMGAFTTLKTLYVYSGVDFFKIREILALKLDWLQNGTGVVIGSENVLRKVTAKNETYSLGKMTVAHSNYLFGFGGSVSVSENYPVFYNQAFTAKTTLIEIEPVCQPFGNFNFDTSEECVVCFPGSFSTERADGSGYKVFKIQSDFCDFKYLKMKIFHIKIEILAF